MDGKVEGEVGGRIDVDEELNSDNRHEVEEIERVTILKKNEDDGKLNMRINEGLRLEGKAFVRE